MLLRNGMLAGNRGLPSDAMAVNPAVEPSYYWPDAISLSSCNRDNVADAIVSLAAAGYRPLLPSEIDAAGEAAGYRGRAGGLAVVLGRSGWVIPVDWDDPTGPLLLTPCGVRVAKIQIAERVERARPRHIQKHPNRKHHIGGQRFGLLVAIHPAANKPGYSGTWVCQCDCGRTTHASACLLLRGQKMSCGCMRGRKVVSDASATRQS